MTLNQRRTLMKGCFMSQFVYCLLLWMSLAGHWIIELIPFTKEHGLLPTMISLLLLPNY